MKIPTWVTEETLAEYKAVVDKSIIVRLRTIIVFAIVLHPIAHYLDITQYPEKSDLFLIIRLLNCLIAALIYGLTYIKRLERWVVWLGDALILDFAAGMLMMIYLTDGASSHFYEGVNICLLGVAVINTYYEKHNIGTCLAVLALYSAAAWFCPTGWNIVGYLTANFFMICVAIFVCLITKFYAQQHLDSFLKNKELALSQEKLAQSHKKLTMLFSQADQMARIDDLTQVYNRRHLMQILEQKMDTSTKSGGYFYVIIFDIDHFKAINDRYGHTFGDKVINAIAQVVQKKIRVGSHLGRYGGDEFIMIFDQADRNTIRMRLEQIASAVREIKLTHDGKEVLFSVSMGAVKVDTDKFSSVTSVIDAADNILLKIKRTERGRIYLGDE